MQVGVTFTESDFKKLSMFADERHLSLSTAVRHLTMSAIDRLNQIEAK